MHAKCPGAGKIRTPEIAGTKTCPQCGSAIEIFSDEVESRCPSCGLAVYNDLKSCIQWCRHAEECVGSEVYHTLKSALDRGCP
jgi:hypothetical protein